MKKEKLEEKDDSVVIDGIEVGNPQLLRPIELPLVVKPADGKEWKNEAQAEYAKILNAYAYKNPKKWDSIISADGMPILRKKDVLIRQLSELGEKPEKLALYRGVMTGVAYKNKLIDKS